MDNENIELVQLKAKFEQFEREMAGLKAMLHNLASQQPASDTPPTPINGPSLFDPARAEATFKQALVTLRTMAMLRNERFIFIGAADPQGVMTSGPQAMQGLLTEESKRALTTLGAALGNPTRVKLLYTLSLQEEATTGLLAETGGTGGGNLFQQLNELHSVNLIFQPSRGRYRLTDFGRLIITVLAWSVSNTNQNWQQAAWFEEEELK